MVYCIYGLQDLGIINGLRWLDLAETDGLTYDQATSTFSDYRVATQLEYQDMFALFAASNDGLFVDKELNGTGIVENDHHNGSVQYIAYGNNESWLNNAFTLVFGRTHESFGDEIKSNRSTGYYIEKNLIRYGGVSAFSWFAGEELDNDSAYEYFHDYISEYELIGSFKDNKSGWFLVKNIESTPVPELAPLVLISFGLLSLLLIAKSKKFLD